MAACEHTSCGPTDGRCASVVCDEPPWWQNDRRSGNLCLGTATPRGRARCATRVLKTGHGCATEAFDRGSHLVDNDSIQDAQKDISKLQSALEEAQQVLKLRTVARGDGAGA